MPLTDKQREYQESYHDEHGDWCGEDCPFDASTWSRLAEGFAGYAEHHPYCPKPELEPPCTCGLAELQSRYNRLTGSA